MRIRSFFRLCTLVALLAGAPSLASADIITFTNPGDFNGALAGFGFSVLDVDFVQNSEGNPLQGQTGGGLFYDFSTSLDTLRAQNLNTVESIDGSFDDLLIDAALPNLWFRAIRFQINPDLVGQQTGTLTIDVEDQFGSNPFILPATAGASIFFGAIGTNGQLIDTVSLTGLPIDTVHNIAIDAIPVDPMPEPGTLLLLGSGLALGIARVRKRFRSQ